MEERDSGTLFQSVLFIWIISEMKTQYTGDLEINFCEQSRVGGVYEPSTYGQFLLFFFKNLLFAHKTSSYHCLQMYYLFFFSTHNNILNPLA